MTRKGIDLSAPHELATVVDPLSNHSIGSPKSISLLRHFRSDLTVFIVYEASPSRASQRLGPIGKFERDEWGHRQDYASTDHARNIVRLRGCLRLRVARGEKA